MNIDEIAAFVTIARLGGFGRAANALHRSQPAISRRLGLLEDELRTPLFERVQGGVVLTEAGRSFLPYAEAVLATIADGAEAVRSLERGDEGAVGLAIVGTLASTSLADALRGFRQAHPKVRLDLRTANSAEVSDLVRRGEATLGLRYFADPAPSLVAEEVSREPLVIACAADHRLAGKRVRDPARLAGERWVSFPVRRGWRESYADILFERLSGAGLADAEIVRIDSVTAQKRFVEAGFGIAMLVESGVEEELRLGTLRTIDVPVFRASIPVILVRRRSGYLGGAARTLMTALRRAL